MIQGTTPTHSFSLPVDAETIKEIRIVYAQKERPVLVKTTQDCTLTEKTAALRLSQQETFRFDPSYEVEIQVRLLTWGGDALASEIIRTTVGYCLGNEVMA
jgi:hypothetical protein